MAGKYFFLSCSVGGSGIQRGSWADETRNEERFRTKEQGIFPFGKIPLPCATDVAKNYFFTPCAVVGAFPVGVLPPCAEVFVLGVELLPQPHPLFLLFSIEQ